MSEEDANAFSGVLEALTAVERFIRGFEGDELQKGIDELLAKIRAALPTEATGRQPSQPEPDLHEALLLASTYIQYVKERNPELHQEADGSPSIEQAAEKAIGRAA